MEPEYIADDGIVHALQVPTSLEPHFPPKNLPLAQLLLYALPPISLNDNNTELGEMFTTEKPTLDIDSILRFLAVPSRATVNKMFSGFDKACAEGKKSLHTSLNPDIAYPFWVLTYWNRMLDASEAKAKWLHAKCWLHRIGQTCEESELRLQIRVDQSFDQNSNILEHRLVELARGNEGLYRERRPATRGGKYLPYMEGGEVLKKLFDPPYLFSESRWSLTIEGLTQLFSNDYLDDSIIDAMLTLLSLRARISGDGTLIVGTVFANFIDLLPPILNGVAAGPIIASSGGQKYLRKYGLWFQNMAHKKLYNVLYRDPQHWTTNHVDFENRHIQYGDGLNWDRPEGFFAGLQSWIRDYHGEEFRVTEDLPCARQKDGFNCGIIAVNSIAHNVFGDVLWTRERAKAMRMKAFCDIMKHALSAETIPTEPEPIIIDPTDSAANILDANVDINDELLLEVLEAAEPEERSTQLITPPAVVVGPVPGPEIPLNTAEVAREPLDVVMHGFIESPASLHPGNAATVIESSLVNRGVKRAADLDEESVERPKKIAKPTEASDRQPAHPFFTSNTSDLSPSTLIPPKKEANKLKAAASDPYSDPFVGMSRSAVLAKKLRAQVKDGTFRPSSSRTATFQQTCRGYDEDAAFERTCSEVQCSTCKAWVVMKEPYNTSRFDAHQKKPCEPPPPEPKFNTIAQFLTQSTRPKPKERPRKISKPCPGLAASYEAKIGIYLEHAASTGGGARSVGHYSQKLSQKDFQDLTSNERDQVATAQLHGRTWQNDTSPGIIALSSTKCLKVVEVDPASTAPLAPCSECALLFTSKPFKTAINKPAPKPEHLKFVPKMYQNTHAGMLYGKFQGLQALMEENNSHSLWRRFLQHVLNGDFKDDKIFTGIIQAKVLAKDRELKGRGMQNFKHNDDLDALFGLFHSISPRPYREIAKHVPLRSERSIKHKISTSPRFPVGIQDATFQFVEKYCEDYAYPCGAPFSLAVDDTKLFSALRPLYDGIKQKWFIVGAIGDPIEVPDVATLHLRLWSLQITLPRVPPLVLAILPIESKVKGPHLAELQLSIMKGLISRRFRVIGSGGDGASVERDYPEYPDIPVELFDLDGNVWVIFQDAKHARKTFRNNAASGARALVLGNYLVYFEQMYTLAMQSNSPMYPRDWKNGPQLAFLLPTLSSRQQKIR
ncbi:hypothetical protein C8R45DRAFT_939782 [Mycena sanguinolenta]|nr:hypothetical protein C8R45DRAFT_939782 [Mycena sanguinolenta]